MQLAELARDRTLVPPSLSPEVRSMRGGFIVIRVRILRAASPDPSDIPDSEIPGLRTRLATEIPQAAAAETAIRTRVDADATAGRLLSLANVDERMRRSYVSQGLVPGTLADWRARLVRSIVWWATANDAALLAPARLDDLHLMVDRRLRIAERMLYDVGRVIHQWEADNIVANPSGPWKDGWNRMFEYPRLPQVAGGRGNFRNIFLGLCNPDASASRLCQDAGLTDWHVRGFEHLRLRLRVRLNPTVRPRWNHLSPDSYELHLQPGQDPVQAIEQLFTPSDDYKNRNLLFCDHVIHILHMESLLWARKKRSANTAWLTGYIGANLTKLRIYLPFAGSDQFLASESDGVFFETERIHVSQAQIGDHLIVHNHPAYEQVSVGGVWRLENAIVVQVYPRRLLQGHGTNPLTIDQMRAQMVGLFNAELYRLRVRLMLGLAEAAGWPSLTIPDFGTRANESQWRDLADRIRRNRTSRSHARALTFALERLIVLAPAAFNEINFGGGGVLVRRFTSAGSLYASAQQYADWWVRWDLESEKDEPAIAADPARRALAWRTHKIEYDAPNSHGYFQIWEPALRANGSAVTNSAGKITRVQEMQVTSRMVSAWTWYLPLDPADRDKLPVIRPRL